MTAIPSSAPQSRPLYRTIWRWHFYAGLLVMPMIIVLSLSGAFYLFKPQVERWEERAFQHLPTAASALPSAQLAAVSAVFPGARMASYRLPLFAGDAAMIHIALPGEAGMRQVFVTPQGRVVGSLDPETRLIAVDRRFHGQLLLGRRGSWLVELAASWAIVLILSGLYLWWSRLAVRHERGLARGGAGVVWPRLWGGRRVFWRDLHAVTGFWVSGLALVLLVTGLPWADAWGSAFKVVRQEMGWAKGPQDWTIGGRPADGDQAPSGVHRDMKMGPMPGMPPSMSTPTSGDTHHGGMAATGPVDSAMLDRLVVQAASQHLAFPVLVVPPGARDGDGGGGSGKAWVVKSDAQNRPLRVVIRYDARTGQQISREDFASRHPIDKIIAYGVAWHEGQLFGLFNQLVGVGTALMLITITVSGFVMWRRRKPEGVLGAPPLPNAPARIRGVAVIVLVLALLLPLFGASLLLVLLFDRLVLPRLSSSIWR